MTLDVSRIQDDVDVTRLADARVLVVGCGGSVGLVENLARSGVRRFTLIDPDVVALENICRTGLSPREIGMPKVMALAERVREITGSDGVDFFEGDFQDDIELNNVHYFGPRYDLVIAATDSFAAQAAMNKFVVARKFPALFLGLYAAGLGGEVVFWYPGLPCFRCLLGNRYRVQAAAREQGAALDPTSHGATIFDVSFLDAIAGHVALGLLLRGTATRFGKLVEELGNRNFLHVKIDPGYVLNGRDVIRERLQVPSDSDGFFSWCVAARRDPDHGNPPCPDCVAAGHAASTGTEILGSR